MFARDITFKCLSTEAPEQYNAYDPQGNLLGYVRVRWGFCTAWCPDCGGMDEVYSAEVRGWWAFASNRERKNHFREIKRCIACWCNEHPGVYGEDDL